MRQFRVLILIHPVVGPSYYSLAFYSKSNLMTIAMPCCAHTGKQSVCRTWGSTSDHGRRMICDPTTLMPAGTVLVGIQVDDLHVAPLEADRTSDMRPSWLRQACLKAAKDDSQIVDNVWIVEKDYKIHRFPDSIRNLPDIGFSHPTAINRTDRPRRGIRWVSIVVIIIELEVRQAQTDTDFPCQCGLAATDLPSHNQVRLRR